MSKVRFELDAAGVRKNILQAPYMLEYVRKTSESKCGSNEHSKPFVGFDRAKAIIYPNTKEHSG